MHLVKLALRTMISFSSLKTDAPFDPFRPILHALKLQFIEVTRMWGGGWGQEDCFNLLECSMMCIIHILMERTDKEENGFLSQDFVDAVMHFVERLYKLNGHRKGSEASGVLNAAIELLGVAAYFRGYMLCKTSFLGRAITLLEDGVDDNIRMNTCWALSSIALEHRHHVTRIMSIGRLVDRLVGVARQSTHRDSKYNATFTLSYMFIRAADHDVVAKMLSAGAGEVVVKALVEPSVELVNDALDAVDYVFKGIEGREDYMHYHRKLLEYGLEDNLDHVSEYTKHEEKAHALMDRLHGISKSSENEEPAVSDYAQQKSPKRRRKSPPSPAANSLGERTFN